MDRESARPGPGDWAADAHPTTRTDNLPRIDFDVADLLLPGAIHTLAQPIVALSDGSLIAYELLARSTLPAGLGPEQWLRQAGERGLRTEVELACLDAAADRGAPPEGIRLFVNVSPTTLLDPRIDGRLARLPPHVVEITEEERIENYKELRAHIAKWTPARTMLAVDDVGSGYSSMRHVLQLRPQFIKIDRDLVHGVHRDKDRLAVLRGIVGYARQCGATSLAEGLETLEDLAALRAIGVDLVQGFLFGRPGDGWPRARLLTSPRRSDQTEEGSSTIVGSISRRLDALIDPKDAADEVTTYLYEHYRVLPSVYVERAGVLRFLSGRGQWQVFDGIEPGVGLTGWAFAQGETVLVQDVLTDPRYRQAAPGVVAELAVPLVVRNRLAGVLNVDAATPLDSHQIIAITSAARLLERTLERTGGPAADDSPFVGLGHHAPLVARATSVDNLATATLQAATEIAHFETGALWIEQIGLLRLAASKGELAGTLAALTPSELGEFGRLVSRVASTHTVGPVFTTAFGPLGYLRDQGLGSIIAAPIRSGERVAGLLVLAAGEPSVAPAPVVEAVELLCALVAAVLRRIEDPAG